jgi:aminoethylphosphonate catabolism LysR family transcriptional regulator
MHHTQLRSFHAVATEGGFTAAAKALEIGQPTITSQVKALEDYFGVELFHRRGRGVQLTEVGLSLLAVTQRLFSLQEEAVDLLNAAGGFHTGHLRVGAVGPYHATEMLARFNERYPEMKVSVMIGNSQEVLQGLLDFRSDIAILARVEEDSRFYAKPYSRHPVVVFVNMDHPWADRKSVKIEELEGQRMVLREVGSTTRLALEGALATAGVTINPVMEIGSREAVWLAVVQGIGIGVVSEIEFIAHPKLRPLTVSNAELYTYAHVVCLEERKDSRLIRAFLQMVDEILARRRQRPPPA